MRREILADETGKLDAAEGRLGGRDQAGVHAHHAVFQRLGDPEDPCHVPGVKAGGEWRLILAEET